MAGVIEAEYAPYAALLEVRNFPDELKQIARCLYFVGARAAHGAMIDAMQQSGAIDDRCIAPEVVRAMVDIHEEIKTYLSQVETLLAELNGAEQ